MTEKIQIGDIVTIIDSGAIYEWYTKAFEYFGFQIYAKKCNGNLRLKPSLDSGPNKWYVRGMVFHEQFKDSLLLGIVNPKTRQCAVIADYGVKKIGHSDKLGTINNIESLPKDVKHLNDFAQMLNDNVF